MWVISLYILLFYDFCKGVSFESSNLKSTFNEFGKVGLCTNTQTDKAA